MTKAEIRRRAEEGQKERLLAFCMPEPNSGCWLWTGSTGAAGYGQLWVNGRIEGSHRAAYRILRGPIPSGMSVLHICDVGCCVNPDHLFLGTQKDNMIDMFAKGRHLTGARHRLGGRTHCKNGHEFTEANTYMRLCRGRRTRYCRACGNDYARRKRAALAGTAGSEGEKRG